MARTPKTPIAFPHRRPDPRVVSALIEQARDLLASGDRAAGARALDDVLRHDPTNPSALNGLGNLAVAARRLDLALDYHRRAVRAAPKNAAFLNDLGNCLLLARDPDAALATLRKAVAASPRLRPALLNLARAYRDLDKPERALATLDKLDGAAAATGGRDTDADLERAVILAQTGRGSEATQLFRAILAVRPADSRAIEGLATSHRALVEDHDLATVEAALNVRGITPLQRAAAHHAAGTFLEDLGSYDEAFDHYRLANEAQGTAFEMRTHSDFVELSIAQFTSSFLLARDGFGHPSDQPVFIVGLPRSGTTLVEQILAKHPDVCALGELADVESGLKQVVREPFGSPAFFRSLGELQPPTIRKAAETYLAAVNRRAGAILRTVDKMPHNYLVLGWIALMFPRARIIHCVREPMDVCVSCYTHHFSAAHAYSTDLATLGAYHKAYVRLMQHWKLVLPIAIHDVHYEAIVADLEGEGRRLINYLGLDWDPRCLAYHESRRIVQTPSQWQVRQPIYRTSVGRWRRFERHLGALRESLSAAASEQAT